MSGSGPRETKTVGKISLTILKHLQFFFWLIFHGTICLCWNSEAICTNESKDRDGAIIGKMGTKNTSFCLGIEEQRGGRNLRKEYEIYK